MAFNPDHLITRQPVFDRKRGTVFIRLDAVGMEYDVAMPFMRRLANIETPQAVYFVPMAWIQDEALLKKLSRDVVLVTDDPSAPLTEAARTSGFRIATVSEPTDAQLPEVDFTIQPWAGSATPSKEIVYTGIDTPAAETEALASAAMYFSGRQFLGTSAAITGGKRINPGHALILELMSAVQQEAEPRDIETLLKRDVTLSFKLLRYINSPWFGLATHVESVRHALSIIGYQQLLKWFTLLAVTAGGESSPALTQTAIVRARFMELVGAKLLDKNEADNLFVTGMLSLLDRCMGVPMEEILQHVNLPPAVSETLMQPDGKYRRFLSLALACEGNALPEEPKLDDIDVRAANIAHLEALEWATQTGKISLS